MEKIIAELEKTRDRGDGMEQEEIENTPKTDVESKQQQSDLASGCVLSSSFQGRKSHDTVYANTRKSSNTSTKSGNTNAPLPGLHTLYRRPELITRSLAPVVPKGELIPLKPRLVTPPTTLPEHRKTKPPKFIPYEPYPGAVNPIVPKETSGKVTPKKGRANKNNLDIGVLVSQMSTLRTQEMVEKNNTELKGEKKPDSDEMLKLRQELEKVKEERDHYNAQFKFQTQVNSELKSLLVASVGEDLQTHVNVLTEDKLQLARALLDTANNLSTHTEQIEFLAGQCEVWRSKFLASSVMIEELARWKADLTQKNQMLNESTKRLLHCTHQVRELQLEILKNLKFLAKIRYLNLPSTDLVSLSAENLNILQQMVLHSGVGMPNDINLNVSSASANTLCEDEKYAVQALQFVSQPLMATDEAIRALFNQTQRTDLMALQTQAQTPRLP